MPSLRKLVENVEYNKLPSPMKPDFASVYKSEKDSAIEKLPDTDTNDGVVKSTTRQNDTNRCKVNPANQNQTGKKTNGGTSNKLVREDDVIELLSDEEDISLDQLAKLKQNGTCTNAISNLTAKISTIADNGTAKVKGAGDKSDSRNGNLAVSTTKNAQALAANKKRPAIANGLMNGTAAAAAAATKPSGATTQPVQLTAANNNNSIPAPQVQYPYSANPTVQQNVNAILQNIRTNLQQTMPQPTLQPFAYGPAAVTAGLGLERWSEHRIDAASTIDDLEAIRNRLITLAKRADLRLKEMNFRKAIGMIESKDDGEQEMDVIRKLVERAESSLTVDSKNEENDRKRTQLEDTSIDPYNNDNSEKRQRSSCCPFCLSNTTPRDTDEMNMCSICEEQSNMCLQCRGYCIKCHRLACEDCLMRCDTCLSDTYCSDCMPKSGKCAKCSFGMNNSVAMGFARPISRTDFPIVLEPRPIAKAITQHTLHRFVVNKAGTLGLSVTEKAGYVFVRAAAKDSHAEKLGVKIHDEICLPFTNGTSAKNIYKTFLQGAAKRPMIFEVKRPFDKPIKQILHRIYITYQGQLGMTIKQMMVPNNRHYTIIASVQPDKLANVHGLCPNDIICKPDTKGSEFLDTYSWFMDSINTRPFIFDVWRSPSTRPPTNPESAVPSLNRTPNPFVWSYTEDESVRL